MVEENAVKRKRFAIGMIIACLAVIGVYIYNFHVNTKYIFQVSMTFYDVMNQEPLADVSVAVARCNGNRVEQEIITDEEGRAVFNLPRGKYTFCWNREGYCDDSRDIAVREEGVLAQYLVPALGKNEAYIIAEWDFDADLDLCVYSGQEERCIVRDGLSEGDHVLGDIADRNYELAYLKDYRHTDYAVFLKDYSASQGAERAEPGAVDIRMYTSGTFPYHERAVLEMQEVPEEGVALYECVRINGGAMEESGRYIEDLSGYSWAVRDKNDPAGWIGESTVQEKETYTYDALGKVSNIECWEYNENGRVIRSVGYNRYKKLDREPILLTVDSEIKAYPSRGLAPGWDMPYIMHLQLWPDQFSRDLAVMIQGAGSVLKVLLLPSLDTDTCMVSTSSSPSARRAAGRLAAALKSRV